MTGLLAVGFGLACVWVLGRWSDFLFARATQGYPYGFGSYMLGLRPWALTDLRGADSDNGGMPWTPQ